MNGYLMREIPLILEEWKREEAKRRLLFIVDSSARKMEPQDFQEYMKELRVQAYGEAALRIEGDFDAEGLSSLRSQLGERF